MKATLNNLIFTIMVSGISLLPIIYGVFMLNCGEDLAEFHLKIYDSYGLKFKGKFRKLFKTFDIKFFPYLLFLLSIFAAYYSFSRPNMMNIYSEMDEFGVVVSILLVLNGLYSIFFREHFYGLCSSMVRKNFNLANYARVAKIYSFIYIYASVLLCVFGCFYLIGFFI